MRRNVIFCTAAVLAVSAVAAAANTACPANSVVYDCTVDNSASHQWLAKRVEFAYDAKDNKVQVLDAMATHYLGHPVDGEVSNDSEGRLVFRWTYDAVDSKHRTVTLKYDATVSKTSHNVFIRTMVSDFANLDVSAGTCVLR